LPSAWFSATDVVATDGGRWSDTEKVLERILPVGRVGSALAGNEYLICRLNHWLTAGDRVDKFRLVGLGCEQLGSVGLVRAEVSWEHILVNAANPDLPPDRPGPWPVFEGTPAGNALRTKRRSSPPKARSRAGQR
jgi:hypothetical protein